MEEQRFYASQQGEVFELIQVVRIDWELNALCPMQLNLGAN